MSKQSLSGLICSQPALLQLLVSCTHCLTHFVLIRQGFADSAILMLQRQQNLRQHRLHLAFYCSMRFMSLGAFSGNIEIIVNLSTFILAPPLAVYYSTSFNLSVVFLMSALPVIQQNYGLAALILD